jgi:hypothetical protein
MITNNDGGPELLLKAPEVLTLPSFRAVPAWAQATKMDCFDTAMSAPLPSTRSLRWSSAASAIKH